MERKARDYNQILRKGKYNAITKKELMIITGIEDERDLRRDIFRSRQAGQIICSSSSNENGGYYLPKNRQEVYEYIRSVERRARNMLKAVKAARKAMKETEERARADVPDNHHSKQGSEV